MWLVKQFYADEKGLTRYSLMRPCALSGGLQETSTFPSSLLSQDSCKFLGGSGTAAHTHSTYMHYMPHLYYWHTLLHETGYKNNELGTAWCDAHLPRASWPQSPRWFCAACWDTEWAPLCDTWCPVSARSVCSWSCCCECPYWSTAACPQVWRQKRSRDVSAWFLCSQQVY